MTGNSNRIPLALTSKSHIDLMKLMLQNNVTSSKEYTYQILNVKGIWYAWYYEDATRHFKGLI